MLFAVNELDICGRDYHGGNIQQGCGAKFYWSTAAPYQANIGTGPKQKEFKLKKPIGLDGVSGTLDINDSRPKLIMENSTVISAISPSKVSALVAFIVLAGISAGNVRKKDH